MSSGPVPTSFTALVGGMETLRRAVISAAGAATPMGAAFRATTMAVGVFSRSISSAADIVAHFSQYSMAGLHAQVMIQIGDIRRNMDISRKSGSEMELFAATTIKARDAWMEVDVEMNKIVLKIGSEWNRILIKLAPAAESFVKSLGSAVDYLLPIIDELSDSLKDFKAYIEPVTKSLSDLGKALIPNVQVLKEMADFTMNVFLPAFKSAVPIFQGLAETVVYLDNVFQDFIKHIMDLPKWLLNIRGKDDMDRKKEIAELAKLVEAQRVARLQAQKDAINIAANQKIIEARELLAKGKLPPERLHEAAMNPFELFMGRIMFDFERMNKVAGKAFGGRVGAGQAALKAQEDARGANQLDQDLANRERRVLAERGRGGAGGAGERQLLHEIKGMLQRLEKLDPAKAKAWRQQLERNLGGAPGQFGMVDKQPGVQVAANQRFQIDPDQIVLAMNNRVLLMSDFDGPSGPLAWMS